MNQTIIGWAILVCGGLWLAMQQSGFIDAWRRSSLGEEKNGKEKDSSGANSQGTDLIVIHSKILELKRLLSPSHPAQVKLDEVGQMMYTTPNQEVPGEQQ